MQFVRECDLVFFFSLFSTFPSSHIMMWNSIGECMLILLKVQKEFTKFILFKFRHFTLFRLIIHFTNICLNKNISSFLLCVKKVKFQKNNFWDIEVYIHWTRFRYKYWIKTFLFRKDRNYWWFQGLLFAIKRIVKTSMHDVCMWSFGKKVEWDWDTQNPTY